jgi:chemotaxis response regulator CheB
MGSTAGGEFRVVCLGGSAGGLEAYVGILRTMRPDSGMAFVVAPHRGFAHAHLLQEILSRATAMPVVEVTQGMLLKPNCVFIMPPGKDMTIDGTAFRLQTTVVPQGWPKTISVFLFSIAEQYQERAVAVILSGMDHDGSAALKAIKMRGGVTFAQSDPAYPSMPQNAIDTGYVDFILSKTEIAAALEDLPAKKR